MKIALLSTNYDLGGAAIVTQRLCRALRALGHDARMIVARPGASSRPPLRGEAEEVIVVPRLQWLPRFLAERAELWLKGVERKNIFKVSSGRFGVPLENIPFVKEADTVMVNWASQGLLSLDSLEKILASGKRVIYTMHDLWPATAICHLPETCHHYRLGNLPTDCHACPYLSTPRGARMMEKIALHKRRIFANPNIKLVAVSNWQRSQALDSYILNDGNREPDIAVIPHPFPIDEYQPGEKLSADGKRLIVMAAARLDDPVKDLPAAVEALNIFARDYPHLAKNVEVAFVGELRDGSSLKLMELPYRLCGLMHPDELRKLYAQASVVLSSSKFETMGATLMEGMACGAIPVTFGDAGQTDIVDDLRNGFIAPRHTPASLAFALSTAFEVLADRQRASSAADASHEFSPAFLHNEVARRFSPEEIARRYLKLM